MDGNLASLEPELAQHEAVVNARKAKEEAERIRLETALGRWIVRRDDAETALQQMTPERNAMIQLRDHLTLNGTKGDRVRAMIWSCAASALLLGATIPLTTFSGKVSLFSVLLGEIAALASGFGLVAWINRRPE